MDPLTKSYPWYTPYQFAGNKPIWAIDLDGLEEILYYYIYNKDGTKNHFHVTRYENIETERYVGIFIFGDEEPEIIKGTVTPNSKRRQRQLLREKGRGGIRLTWDDGHGRATFSTNIDVSSMDITDLINVFARWGRQSKLPDEMEKAKKIGEKVEKYIDAYNKEKYGNGGSEDKKESPPWRKVPIRVGNDETYTYEDGNIIYHNKGDTLEMSEVEPSDDTTQVKVFIHDGKESSLTNSSKVEW